MPDPTPADRLALAVCPYFKGFCKAACPPCREDATAVAREHHGGNSTTADWIDKQ
jgi:hypothetical protein